MFITENVELMINDICGKTAVASIVGGGGMKLLACNQFILTDRKEVEVSRQHH